MNGYKFHIWHTVSHNGKFSHTQPRTQIVHARSEDHARRMLKLAKGETKEVSDNWTVTTSDEWIYAIDYLGRVKLVTRKYYQYSKSELTLEKE